MRILIVEDEPTLGQQLKSTLEQTGYAVDLSTDGEDGHFLGSTEQYDAAILDLGLPEIDGLTVLGMWRKEGRNFPVLVLTARDSWSDKVAGLDAGADDYLAKPFEPRELQARLRAILRRKGMPAKSETLRFGRLEIDKGARVVRVDGEERAITSYQFALLIALAERAGRVLSRDALMDLLKGEKLEAFDRSVDVHISRIRAAIEDDAKKPRRILTIRGAGYVFAKDQDR